MGQSAATCEQSFSKAIISSGYQQSKVDHTLFITHQKGKLTLLIVYVDDRRMIGDDLIEEVEINDLGSCSISCGFRLLL